MKAIHVIHAVLVLFLCLVFALGIRGIMTGRIRGKGWSGTEAITGQIISREEKPILFWITVLAHIAGPPVILVSIFVSG